MHKIFVNFRGGDEDLAAPFVYDSLSRQFGPDRVFLSSDSIQPAADFTVELLEHARHCTVLLALIGPRWLTITGPDGRPKLEDPDDWVRREIATALAASRLVLPVLVAGAKRLTEDDLPADIVALARRQYLHLRRRDHQSDMQRMEDELIRLIPGLVSGRSRNAWRDERHGLDPALPGGGPSQTRADVTAAPAGDISVRDVRSRGHSVVITGGSFRDANVGAPRSDNLDGQPSTRDGIDDA